jgi:hypothetical protein
MQPGAVRIADQGAVVKERSAAREEVSKNATGGEQIRREEIDTAAAADHPLWGDINGATTVGEKVDEVVGPVASDNDRLEWSMIREPDKQTACAKDVLRFDVAVVEVTIVERINCAKKLEGNPFLLDQRQGRRRLNAVDEGHADIVADHVGTRPRNSRLHENIAAQILARATSHPLEKVLVRNGGIV